MFFKEYFAKRKILANQRKFRVVRFGEVNVHWKNGTFTVFSVIFFENDNGQRKWTVSGGDYHKDFKETSYYAPCQTWFHTGLWPEWSKDPVAEKLSR